MSQDVTSIRADLCAVWDAALQKDREAASR